MMNGIDVSAWQGEIDFDAVKKSGVDFVIIKAGGSDDGFYTDSKFEVNYKNAVNAGLHVGAYYFVGKDFTSGVDGTADAERFYNIIKGKKFSMPVYVDIEAPPTEKKAGITEAALAFCRYMEGKKYWCGIYGSEISTFIDRLYCQNVEPFTWWVANYSEEPVHGAIWQNSSTGIISGVDGYVDTNICYVNFPIQIIDKGYNGYPDTRECPTPNTTKQDLENTIIDIENKLTLLKNIIDKLEV